MVAQEPEIVRVEHDAGSLHFNPPERVLHNLHHHTEVGQKLPVLLRFGTTRQHESIAAVVPGEFQPLYVVSEIQVEERQIVIHLVFVGVAVHFADAESAVIDAAFVRNDDRQRLNFQDDFLTFYDFFDICGNKVRD